MKRLLFVDDEPRVLEGLRRMLYPLRQEWRMSFVGSGPDALRFLDLEPFDVLVTDIQMPGMNGIELLSQVIKRHPQVLRLVLSGTAEQEYTMRSVLLAHQFLVKPCDPAILKSALGRIFSLREMLRDPALKRVIARIHTLPSVPSAYRRLMEALRSTDVSAHDVGAIVAEDMAMTAKVLQLINSPFFGICRPISDAREAVLYLGVDTVRSLALSVAAFSQFDGLAGSCFSMEKLRCHALAVATLGRSIGKSLNLAKSALEETFAAGLLHDIGRLVLASNCTRDYESVLVQAARTGITIREAEQQTFGTTHSEVGAYLLWLWGLPSAVVEATAFHHRPSAAPTLSVAAALVHIGEALLAEDDAVTLDEEALDTLGWRSQLPRWRTLATAMLAGDRNP